MFSDRDVIVEHHSRPIMGSEYVRTYNSDKATSETDVTYTVTLSQSLPGVDHD